MIVFVKPLLFLEVVDIRSCLPAGAGGENGNARSFFKSLPYFNQLPKKNR
jgi:hypothetical protein